jgi:hypothetical protein
MITTIAVHGMAFQQVTYEDGLPGDTLMTIGEGTHVLPSLWEEPAGVKISPYNGEKVTMRALVPTPAFLLGNAMGLRSISILFDADRWGFIEQVEVYDGPQKINTAAVTWTGSHLAADPSNTITLPDVKVSQGLVVLVRTRHEDNGFLLGRYPQFGVVRLVSVTAAFWSDSPLQRALRSIFGS